MTLLCQTSFSMLLLFLISENSTVNTLKIHASEVRAKSVKACGAGKRINKTEETDFSS